MSTPPSLESALAEVESALAQVGDALQTSEAQALQRASEQLRHAAVAFSGLLISTSASQIPPPLVVRVRTVAVRLASQRDALARVAAVVDRQVATVVPQKKTSPTYGSAGPRGNGRSTPYGSSGG